MDAWSYIRRVGTWLKNKNKKTIVQLYLSKRYNF